MMDFIKPLQEGFTIYSKSGCPNCMKIKNLLIKNKLQFTIINCDEYLLENKTEFLFFIREHSKVECKTFPIIFHNGIFISSFTEAEKLIEKLCLFSFDENF